MSLLGAKKSPEDLEEELGTAQLESEVLTYQTDIAQKRAVISQLKKEYGPDWKRILGVNKMLDIQTLRSFLRSAKKGMEKSAMPRANKNMNPLPTGRVRRA